MSRAESPSSTADRVVRSIDVAATDVGAVSNAIEDMYDDVLDVIVIRNAFDRERLSAAGEALDRAGSDPGWARPNEKMPVEDIQLLGTDTPATPTYQAPRGASLDAYLESAKRHRAATESVFDAGFDAAEEFRRVLGAFSGGRPVDIAVNFDGRQYVPFTIRRLVDGRQIGIHHDYHYPLDLYKDLATRLDTRTLISFVVTLQRPNRAASCSSTASRRRRQTRRSSPTASRTIWRRSSAASIAPGSKSVRATCSSSHRGAACTVSGSSPVPVRV